MTPSGQAQSLRGRITAAILLTAVTVLFVGCSLFMIEQHRAEQIAGVRSGQRLASAFADAQAQALSRGDLVAVRQNFIAISHMERILGGVMVEPDGRLITGFGDRTLGTGRRAFHSALQAQGRRLGQLTLYMQPIGQTVAAPQLLAMGAALFFAATGLALFLGRWLANRVSGPVARLSQTMTAVGESGVFSVRVEPGAPDEIGRLTETFNELMARLHMNDLKLRRTMAELTDARDAAEAANVAKSQFLANMSHEIRTPLNGVLAMAQVLALSEIAPAQRDQVDVIRQSGESLLALLNDILDVSKIEAGKLELEVADFDLETVVRGACAAFAPVVERKGLSFVVDVEPGAKGLRRGDAARLRQILNNFLSNAVKFTATGEIGLSVRGEGPDGADGVWLTVQDSGIGIPDEKRPLLFQKFTQLDASTTRKFGGTGLGLAICQELCDRMGGRVWVESEEGRGSSFHATLPLMRIGPAPEQATTPIESSAEGAGPATLRVLAAEDNPTNQLVLTTIMQIFGFDLVVVGDGAEAVETWRNGAAFDVILMDIQMPRMDGVSATRAIRAVEALEGRLRTPIIALSANALTHQVQEYMAAGMDGHVAKPIELDKLQGALEAILFGEAPAGEVAA